MSSSSAAFFLLVAPPIFFTMADNGRVLALLPVLFLLSGSPVELPIGTPVKDAASKATFTFLSVVTDSRCPKGTTCVWEGDAVIELRVMPEGGEPETVQLHLNARTGKDVVVGSLRLTLERLEPYPEEGRAISARDYRAILAITHE
jgi:hypothetical protein